MLFSEGQVTGRGCSTKDKVFYKECETHSYGDSVEKMCFCSFFLCNPSVISAPAPTALRVLLAVGATLWAVAHFGPKADAAVDFKVYESEANSRCDMDSSVEDDLRGRRSRTESETSSKASSIFSWLRGRWPPTRPRLRGQEATTTSVH